MASLLATATLAASGRALIAACVSATARAASAAVSFASTSAGTGGLDGSLVSCGYFICCGKLGNGKCCLGCRQLCQYIGWECCLLVIAQCIVCGTGGLDSIFISNGYIGCVRQGVDSGLCFDCCECCFGCRQLCEYLFGECSLLCISQCIVSGTGGLDGGLVSCGYINFRPRWQSC